MVRRIAPLWIAVCCLATTGFAQQAGIFSDLGQAKLPVPEAAAQQKALALLGEVYKAEYEAAKTPADRASLARKMLAAADQAGDPAERFVLLRVARDTAAGAGELTLACQAVDAMAAAYEMDDPLAMKVEAVEKAARAASSPDAHRAIVSGVLELIDEAAEKDDFEVATRLGRFAASSARKTRDAKLVNQVVTRTRQIERTQREYVKVKAALERMETDPADPASNLIVGRYLCLVKGDWEKGLAMLALGSDEPLKSLAVKELRGATTTADQVALGDGWWDQAQQENGLSQDRMQARARHWYTQALPDLTGLARTKVERRMEEEGAEPKVASPKASEHYLAPENLKNVAFLTYSPANRSWKNDASHLFRITKTPDGYGMVCSPDRAWRWKMILFPKEDVVSTKLRATLTVQRGECRLCLEAKNLPAEGLRATVPAGQKHTVELWIEDGQARATLDGAPLSIKDNRPQNFGFYGLAVTENAAILFQELRFERRK